MKEGLYLFDIIQIYIFVAGSDPLLNNNRTSHRTNFVKTCKKNNIEPLSNEGKGKAFYAKEDILKVFSLSTRKFAILKESNWEEILILKKKAIANLNSTIEARGLNPDENKVSRYHNRLRKKIESLMEKGKSIRKELKDYYSTFYTEVEKITNINTAIMVVMNHRSLLKEWIEKEDLGNKNFMTLERSTYKEDLEEALVYYQIPPSIKKAFEIQNLKNLRKKLENQKELPIPLEDLTSFLEKLFTSPNPLDKVVGIFLATGRRRGEVLKEGVFREDKKNPMALYMKGVLKKGDDKKEIEIHFPTLFKGKDIIEALEVVRKARLYYQEIGNYVKNNFSSVAGLFT